MIISIEIKIKNPTYFFFSIFVLMGTSSAYKPVMGVLYEGAPITDLGSVLRIVKSKQDIEFLSWPNGEVLFYLDSVNGDIVYPHDVTYSYMIDDEAHTALELVTAAKRQGFIDNDTRGAAAYLSSKGHSVRNNPNPTSKFIVPRNH